MIEEIEDLQETYSRTGTFKLGDRKELCDRLNGMVRSGHQTATCDALTNYNTEPEAMRKVRRCDITTEIVLAEGKIRIWKDREKIRKRFSDAMLAFIHR